MFLTEIVLLEADRRTIPEKTILGIDPLVLVGIVLVIGIALAILAFVYYRRSFARREATQQPPRPSPRPQ